MNDRIPTKPETAPQQTAGGGCPSTSCCASDFLDASFSIGAEYEALNHRVDKMMEKRGWKRTCKTPGSIWLWEKTMPDGRVILTDRGTAGMLEEQMCHEESLHND